jgi:multidrug resistance efflux pump
MDSRARIDNPLAARRPDQGRTQDAETGSQDAQSLRRTLEQRLNQREEAEAQQVSPQPAPSRAGKRIIKAVAGVMIIAVFGWLPLQALWQISSVEALVNSRLVTLRAPIDGQVVSATNLAAERGVVDRGTLVLRIVNSRSDRARLDDLRRQRARLENERSSVTAKLDSARKAQRDLARQASLFRDGRMRQLEARLAENEAAIGAAKARSEEASAAVERSSSLVRSGSVSTVEFARLTREQRIAQHNVIAAQRRLEATQIELGAARDGSFLGDSYNDRPSSMQKEEEMRQRIDVLSADLENTEAEISSLSSEIQVEEFRYNNQSEALVKLPVAGRIWEIMTAEGEDVRAGQPLARILDCSSTVVTANVTERVYNRLQIGAPARFIPADGSAEVRGTVVNLTGAAGVVANLAISPDALNKEPYRVTVSMPHEGAGASDCKVGRTGRVIFDSAPKPVEQP